MRKHRDINLVTTETSTKYLVSEPNRHTTKFFTEYLLATEMKKMQIIVNKTFYFWHSILELSKIITHEFLYDYVKPKYGEKVKLCYMDTGSFVVYIKQMIFTKMLQMMLKLEFTLQIMNLDRPLFKGKKK